MSVLELAKSESGVPRLSSSYQTAAETTGQAVPDRSC